jgi:hypothetical protein
VKKTFSLPPPPYAYDGASAKRTENMTAVATLAAART